MNQPRVADYSITHLAQCDGERGVCPDLRVGGSNDVVLGKIRESEARLCDIFAAFSGCNFQSEVG